MKGCWEDDEYGEIEFVFRKAKEWADAHRQPDWSFREEALSLYIETERVSFNLGLENISPFCDMPDGYINPKGFLRWYKKNAPEK
jgi:hypothetical protein